ncbi:MAG: substrate-binding domain-containing protein [Lentisphaeria bacterium]|nr:substrate-binding domain-containing protein [Lentisphaeria bacterium]
MHKKTNDAIKKIEKAIRKGELACNGFLPSERELCKQFAIGRGSLHAVFDELEKKKLIRRVSGKGARIVYNTDTPELIRKFLMILPMGLVNFRAGEAVEILLGTTAAADSRSAEVVLSFTNKPEERLCARLEDGNFDGVIFLERINEASLQIFRNSAVRFIVANWEEAEKLPSVSIDFRGIGRMAGRYLFEHGFRKIGFAGGPESTFIYKEMFCGLKGALAEEDLTADPALVLFMENGQEEKYYRKRISQLLKKAAGNHAAIFTGRDRWAELLYRFAGELNIRIPEDVSIISYDNTSWQEGEKAGLTTIVQPAFETGQKAFELLYEAVCNGKDTDSAILTGKIMERQSVRNNKIKEEETK